MRNRSFKLTALTVALLGTTLSALFGACAKKEHAGTLSPVIYARQRSWGFMFDLKSPGESLDAEGLRKFADSVKGKLGEFYKPAEFVEFQAEGHAGIVDDLDIAYEAAMAGYDDVILLLGEVDRDGFDGRVRIITAAAGGPVFDQELDVDRTAETAPAEQQQETQPAAGDVSDAVWAKLRPALIENYRNPNDYPALGDEVIKRRQRLEGYEMLAEKMIQQAGIPNVFAFQTLSEEEMKEKYRHINYAKNLLEKIREGYVSGDLPSRTTADVKRIQDLRDTIGALSDITTYYEEEILATPGRFEVAFEFENVNPDLQRLFRGQLAASGLEEVLKAYTTKPVTLNIIYDRQNDTGTVFLELRYVNRVYLKSLSDDRLVVNDTRVLRLEYFYKLMASMLRYRDRVFAQASPDQRRMIQNFGLVLELQRKLFGYLQIPVGAYEGRPRPFDQVRTKLCDYPPTSVETAKPQFTQKTGLFALGPPQTLGGQRLPHSNIYEFFSLDDLYNVEYPKACELGRGVNLLEVGAGTPSAGTQAR